MTARGTPHHLELWVADLASAEASLGWLLEALGYLRTDSWQGGASWTLGDTYVVIEASPDVLDAPHERRRPGLNHLAFHAGSESDVDLLTLKARRHGWSLLFADRHPHAGGPGHYAAYLENKAGFEVELVATHASAGTGTRDSTGTGTGTRDSTGTGADHSAPASGG